MPHFNDLDPNEPLEHYDDYHDKDGGVGSRFGPYNPKHPIREGFTMGVCATVVAGLVIWLLTKVL